VTIDLQSFTQLTLSSNSSRIQIGTGNRWENVYSYLDPRNLSTSGGRVAIVGVGGLTTGGGISFFSPRYGFVCDNVENFEVVLASGQLVNANATSNPDLWRALRGGSNNFGIVTTFTMRVFEQGKFWGGFIGFSSDTFAQQFQAFEDLLGSPDYDPYAALIFSLVYNVTAGYWYSASNFEYTKPIVNPPFFQNFTSLPQTFSTMRISNLTDFTGELTASNPPGFRQLFVTGTYGNSAQQIANIYSFANTSVHSVSDVAGLKWSVSFQPQPTAITSKAATNGGNSLGLSAADGNVFNVLLTASWDDEADDERVNAAVKSVFDQAEVTATELGIANKYLYLNYAAPWQDPIVGYGAANVAALQTASRKYDPDGVFQYQVPGSFKLFNQTRGTSR
jgi:FAD/FMN-containing dehydrogenase